MHFISSTGSWVREERAPCKEHKSPVVFRSALLGHSHVLHGSTHIFCPRYEWANNQLIGHYKCQGFHIIIYLVTSEFPSELSRNVDSSFWGSHDDFVESGSYHDHVEAELLLAWPFGRVSSRDVCLMWWPAGLVWWPESLVWWPEGLIWWPEGLIWWPEGLILWLSGQGDIIFWVL